MNGPRIVLNDDKLAEWLVQTFGIRTRVEAFARLTEIDPLNETVTVDGLEHRIPPECYVDLFEEKESAA